MPELPDPASCCRPTRPASRPAAAFRSKLIIVLGMLVDNAIVVTDGILVRLQRGEERRAAAIAVVQTIQWPLLGGTAVGIYREGDSLVPIIARAPLAEREDAAALNNVQVYSPTAGRYLPVGQLIQGTDLEWVDAIVRRVDRFPTLQGPGRADASARSDALPLG